MISGHGDDLHLYPNVWANFSSNVYAMADHSALVAHLGERLPHCLGSYPEPEPMALQCLLAEELGLKHSQVLVTNGATEAIYLIAQATARARTHIIQPTFSEYADACRLHGHSPVEVGEAETLWCCNPNNPTGRILNEGTLSASRLVVIDRSYQYFGRLALHQPSAEEVEGANRLYIHSLTKRYRIPGLRLGYIIGPSPWIERLRALRQPWSVNALAIEAGLWIVRHHFPESIDRAELWRESDRFGQALSSLGYEVEPTDTHFMLVRTPHPAHELKEYLAREHGLLVRNASNFETLTPYHLRLAPQTPTANDALIEALRIYNGMHS